MSSWKYTKNISINEINRFESENNITFPEDYKNFILENNGGRPSLNAFDTLQSKGRVFLKLLSFDKSDKDNIFRINSELKNDLPSGFIPIALDPFGNLIGYVFSNEKVISFWLHENAELEYVSNSFSDLINGLH